jgi:DNA-binding FadR family transcriptional regulator
MREQMIETPKILTNKPQRANLTRECISSIRSYILTNHMSAGDKLPSFQEWAELLDVSVLVVREAFRSLEALGFVDIRHGRGIFLRGSDQIDFLDFISFNKPLDEFTLKEVVEARAMLDLTVLELSIMRADQEAIHGLEEILEKMDEDPSLVAVESPQHKLFHQIMLESTGNQLLIRIGAPLLNTFWRMDRSNLIILTEAPYSVDEVDHHRAFLDAICNRDLTNARELVDRHLFGACSKYHIFPLVSNGLNPCDQPVKGGKQ